MGLDFLLCVFNEDADEEDADEEDADEEDADEEDADEEDKEDMLITLHKYYIFQRICQVTFLCC